MCEPSSSASFLHSAETRIDDTSKSSGQFGRLHVTVIIGVGKNSPTWKQAVVPSGLKSHHGRGDNHPKNLCVSLLRVEVEEEKLQWAKHTSALNFNNSGPLAQPVFISSINIRLIAVLNSEHQRQAIVNASPAGMTPTSAVPKRNRAVINVSVISLKITHHPVCRSDHHCFTDLQINEIVKILRFIFIDHHVFNCLGHKETLHCQFCVLSKMLLKKLKP